MGTSSEPVRILAVCAGNICRSPTAEAAIREAAGAAGVEVVVDSAGIGSWHVGESPDRRMREAAAAAGLELTGLARQVTVADFEDFDLLLPMDRANEAALLRLAPTPQAAAKVRPFMSYDGTADALDVPDPYYGDAAGFDAVVTLVRSAARALVDALDRHRS